MDETVQTLEKEFEVAKEFYEKLQDFDFESRRRILGFLLINLFRQEKDFHNMAATITAIITNTLHKDGWIVFTRYVELLLQKLATQG